MNEHDFQLKWAAAHEALVVQASEEAEHEGLRTYERCMLESLRGDASLIPVVANGLLESLVLERAIKLSAAERLWLIEILSRARGEKAARILSGKTGKGAPRKGKKSLDIAFDVVRELMDNDQSSMEAAWAAVADKRCMDAVTVRKYWAEWKPSLDGMKSENQFKNIVRRNKERKNTDRK